MIIQNKDDREATQSPAGILAMEEGEDGAGEPADAEREPAGQVLKPLIGEPTPVSDPLGTALERRQEVSLFGVQSHEPDATQTERKFSLLVDIHQSVSLLIVEETGGGSIEGAKKTEVEVSLQGNPHYEALVARLAIRGKEKVARNQLMADIYGNRIDEQAKMEQSFYDDMRRIREQVKKSLEKWFPQTAPKVDQLKLFESSKKSWYLSSSCRVRGGGVLNKWYRTIKAIKATDTGMLPENESMGIAQLLIEDYSQQYLDKHEDEEAYTGGYLLQKLHEDPFASWAPGFFVERRNQYIFVMTFIAEGKHRMGVSTRQRSYFVQAAKYFKECAYAATCSPVDQKQGERALRSCVEMYMCAQDVDAAEGVIRVYAKRMGRIISGWEPGEATRAMVQRYNLIYD